MRTADLRSMESTVWLGSAIFLGLVLLALWARGRDGSVTSPSSEAGAATVADLLHAGRKIEAIKLYRRQHGVGLKEAKEAVEALGQGLPK